MAVTPPDHRPRRLWLLPVGVTLLLIVASAAYVRERLAAPLVAVKGETRISNDVVVERVQSVAKLVSSETTVRDVVTYENTRFGSTKRSLVVVTGKVLAGIDLDKGTDVSIDQDARRISVTLPPAEILGAEILNLRTYDERDGLLNPFRPTDRDMILQQVRGQLLRAGRETGIIEHANRSAKAMLETLLATDGYTVDVQIRSRPIETQQR
jgi:hypothetical protein